MIAWKLYNMLQFLCILMLIVIDDWIKLTLKVISLLFLCIFGESFELCGYSSSISLFIFVNRDQIYNLNRYIEIFDTKPKLNRQTRILISYMKTPDTQTSVLAPLGAKSKGRRSPHQQSLFHQKEQLTLSNQRETSKGLIRNPTATNKQEDNTVQDQDSGDSSFEYSQDIMKINPRNQTRKEKEQGRLSILMTFDWMRQTTTKLKLSRQVLYRAALTLRKFLLIQKRNPNSNITVSNIRLFGLAAILLSNKLQNINGNFLNGKSMIINGEVRIQKQRIVDCEIEILMALKYTIPIRSLITECIIKIVQRWNIFIESCKYDTLRLDYRENQKRGEWGLSISFFQTFLHLTDYVFLRKITGINLKDLNQLNNLSYYEPTLVNILYNLSYYTIKQTKQGHDQLRFRQSFTQFVFKLNPEPNKRSMYCRQSHNLTKRIKQIFLHFQDNTRRQSPKELRKLYWRKDIENQENLNAVKLLHNLENVTNAAQISLRSPFNLSETEKTQDQDFKSPNEKTKEQNKVENGSQKFPEQGKSLPQKKDNLYEKDNAFVPPIVESQTFVIRCAIDRQRYMPIIFGQFNRQRDESDFNN